MNGDNMTKSTTEQWIFYLNEHAKDLDALKIGKWMIYFTESGRQHIFELCEKAVDENIVPEAKVSRYGEVACLYMNIDDIEYHRKCIEFMLANGLIRKTKSGRYYNISFKKDLQTLNGEYGNEYIPQLKLDEFIDLYTGEWVFNDHTVEVDFDSYCRHYLTGLRDEHKSYLERLENTSYYDDEEKKKIKHWEYENYNGEIHICQICQNAYKRIREIEKQRIFVLIPDGINEPLFTPVCTDKPVELLRKYYGKKRYPKKISSMKLKKKMKRLSKSVFDINASTGIRISTLEKYMDTGCTISILNLALIASVLKCGMNDLVE